jgi:hypothetical protein
MATPGPLKPVAVIDGRSGRRLNNALTITFTEGDSPPFAKAQQGAGDSFGGKLGILFGFRNGSVGNNELTYADGSKLFIRTRDSRPTAITWAGGIPVATIARGETSSATLPDGTALLSFRPHPTDATLDSMYRMIVLDPAGARVASLDVIRTNEGWDISAEDVLDIVLGNFGGSSNSSLPMPFRGTRLVVYRELSQTERDVLLAACCEIALSARPYDTAMGARGTILSPPLPR